MARFGAAPEEDELLGPGGEFAFIIIGRMMPMITLNQGMTSKG